MAGANTQDIKRRIKSVSGIEHITNAMKLVSAAKLARARVSYENMQSYIHYVTDAIQDIFTNNPDDIPRDYLTGTREIKKRCFVTITSNRGLAGSFNSNIIKQVEQEAVEDKEKPYLITVGSRGRDYFAKRGYSSLGEYLRPPEDINFRETHEISKPIIEMYLDGKIDEVVMVHTSYISSIEQRVKQTSLLPFHIEADPDVPINHMDVEYEPSPAKVFNYLVPKFVEIMVYGAIVESAICEHAARRMAMDNATDNARSLTKELNQKFNRARQAAITSEITEIVSGAEALE